MARVIYWLLKTIRKNKGCKSCCVTCEYYEACKNDGAL